MLALFQGAVSRTAKEVYPQFSPVNCQSPIYLYFCVALATGMKKFCIFIYGLFLFSVADLTAQKITAEKYIETYKDLAVSEMKRSGIPASITLAQGMLESGNGNSRLATVANNHFGIKCHGWEGQEIYHNDDRKGECFRHYKSANESYLDHTDFLMTRSRYAFLFEYKSDDYKGWATGLRKAGYATDPNYPKLLINLIERYNLHQYDTDVVVNNKSAGKKKTASSSPASKGKTSGTGNIDNFSISLDAYTVKQNNNTEYIIARGGDTYASLSKDLNLMPWQLPKYNEVHASAPISEGQIIYLQPKRRKAESGKEKHTVQEGETMYDISQKYAVRLSRLYKLNGMPEGKEPLAGETVNLRKKRK
jgi:LysM repeat protein